ncbi:MAG TPA: dihydrodipicolinate synthase family protein, partial [Bauldia sp.]|nr:dihydrodipicolinate synthase family protein [Bauldia sp.]
RQMQHWRGVFAIVTTPFDEHLKVDFEGLRATVRFCIAAGVGGVVSTANASEVGYLNDAERRRVAEVVAEEAAGKAVAIVGISCSCWPIAAELARHAEASGADGLMAMPPTMHRPVADETCRFYGEIAAASSLPIMVQNYAGPGGTVLSVPLLARLVREIGSIRYIKEETEFSGPMISEIRTLQAPNLLGVMGGRAGIRMIDEHRRGACGTMPACEVADVHVAVWSALERGDIATAKELHRRLLPLLSLEASYGAVVYKQVLARRGIIGNAAVRQTGGRILDSEALAELDEMLADLDSLMLEAYRPARPRQDPKLARAAFVR